jgi:hypothetical protein
MKKQNLTPPGHTAPEHRAPHENWLQHLTRWFLHRRHRRRKRRIPMMIFQ